MRKYIIEELVTYHVEAASPDEALATFLENPAQHFLAVNERTMRDDRGDATHARKASKSVGSFRDMPPCCQARIREKCRWEQASITAVMREWPGLRCSACEGCVS